MAEERLVINFDEFTLGDIEDFERETGVDFMQMAGKVNPLEGQPMKVLTTLIYLVRRQQESGYTLEQARATRIADLPAMFGGQAQADPTPASMTPSNGQQPATELSEVATPV